MKRFFKVIGSIICIIIIILNIKYLYGFLSLNHSRQQALTKNTTSTELKAKTDNAGAIADGANANLKKENLNVQRGTTILKPKQQIEGESEKVVAQKPNIKAATKKKDKIFITYNELLEIDKLGFFDKLRAFTILRKLKKSDISTIYYMARGGITYPEYSKLKLILSKSLSHKDITRLSKLLEKSKEYYLKEIMKKK